MAIHWPKHISIQIRIFIVIIALSIVFHLFGFGSHIGLSYKAGQYGNQWLLFWGAALGLIIDFQACYMLYKYWKKMFIQRKIIWSIYCIWMFSVALMLIVANATVTRNGEATGSNGILAVWGSTWVVTLFIIINITWFENIQRLCDRKVSAENVLPPIFLRSKTENSSQNEGEQWENIANNYLTTAEQTVHPTKNSSCNCRKYNILKCIFKGIGWSSIGFLSIFAFLLAMQAAWRATDILNYGALGDRITIQMNTQMNLSNVASVISESTIKMHILCKGSLNSGSTFILEADNGAFSASFFALQDHLAAYGRRSCIYDRAGYGWSDTLPIPTNSYQSMFHLHELLKETGESAPYIMIGHSVGGQLIQIYAALFPDQISGLVMLDSVPDFIYLLSLTGKPLNSHITFADLQPYMTSTKSLLDFFRVATPFGIHRWLQETPDDYQPSELIGYYKAGYGRTLNWHAQYFDYIGTPNRIEILDSLSSQKYLNGFGWPVLRNSNTPVLGIITNTTAGGPGPLCSSSTDNSCTSEARLGRAYYDGIRLQTTTISNNSTFIVCDAPCSHSFVFTSKIDWLTQIIRTKFAGI